MPTRFQLFFAVAFVGFSLGMSVHDLFIDTLWGTLDWFSVLQVLFLPYAAWWLTNTYEKFFKNA